MLHHTVFYTFARIHAGYWSLALGSFWNKRRVITRPEDFALSSSAFFFFVFFFLFFFFFFFFFRRGTSELYFLRVYRLCVPLTFHVFCFAVSPFTPPKGGSLLGIEYRKFSLHVYTTLAYSFKLHPTRLILHTTPRRTLIHWDLLYDSGIKIHSERKKKREIERKLSDWIFRDLHFVKLWAKRIIRIMDEFFGRLIQFY